MAESIGVDLIAAERKRQVAEEGWTVEHDDTQTHNELVLAAAYYALVDFVPFPKGSAKDNADSPITCVLGWPWTDSRAKPKDLVSNLIRAGALIAAELDRLHRLQEEGEV